MHFTKDFVVTSLSPEHTSLLDEAVRNYDIEQVDRVLTAGRYNVNTDGLTSALHILLSDGFRGHMNEDAMLDCMNRLIASGCDINAKNQNGESPLSLAVLHGFERAAHILVESGADTSMRSPRFEEHHSLATEIARTMPEVMIYVMDSGVKWSKGDTDVTLDWGPILQYSSTSEESGKKQHGIRRYKDLQKESSFLHSLLEVTKPDETRNRYLTHPLVSVFLHLKRCKIPYWVPLFKFGLAIFPLFYMLFAYYLYFQICKMSSATEKQENCPPETSEEVFTTKLPAPTTPSIERVTCDVPIWLGISADTILFFLSGCALFEIYMLMIVSSTYVKSWRSWVIRVSIVVMACTVFPGVHGQFKDDFVITWQYPLAAVGMFLGWVLFLVQMELLPIFKIYLEILVSIITSVLKIIALFVPMLFGFYMAFDLLYIEFGHIMKFVMMILDPGSGEFLCNEKQDGYWYRMVAYTFSAMFAVLIGIVFVNFLLGASISDIQKLKERAKVTTLSNKVLNHYLTELFSRQIYNVVTAEDVKTKNWYYTFSPNDNYGQIMSLSERRWFDTFVPKCINWNLCKVPERKLPKKITDSLIELLKAKAGAGKNGHSSFDSYEELTAKVDKLEGKINTIIDNLREIRSDNQTLLHGSVPVLYNV